MKRIPTLLGALLALLVTSVSSALAQPAITSPTANQVFRAGPDYASDVLQDPWDFSNIDDVSQHPDDNGGWAQSATARGLAGPTAFALNGKFVGTTSNADPNIGLLYQGGDFVLNPGRSGLRYPVDTQRYRKLAFKMNVNGASQSSAVAYWFLGAKNHLTPAPLGGAMSPTPVTNGERIYVIDLVGNYFTGAAYQGLAAGLRLDPVSESGVAAELDWVRLTAPDGSGSAVSMTVNANSCAGSGTLEVIDGGTATIVATGTPPYSFNYGIFPPGAYQLRLTCGNGAATQPFVINDPPHISVLQPDERGGADYATTVLGNPWDFADAADLPASYSVQILGDTAPQRLHAQSAPPSLGDPNLYLLNREGGGRPIATTRYRYLTFSLGLNASFNLGADGTVARVLWGSGPLGFDGNNATSTKPMMVWPGVRTYTIDLAQLSQASNTLEACAACFPWTARSARYFRLDPHEYSSHPVDFLVGPVTLAAPDEVTQGGTFPIQWSMQGATVGTVNLYYDSDTNPASGLQPIVANLPITSTTYNWSVGGLAPGDYYIYVQASETTPNGTDTRGAYSTGVLRVIAAANNPIVNIASHASGGSAYVPFSLSGCAYNAATGAASDEVIVYAHPLQGQMGGAVQLLGYNAAGGLGTLSAAACASGPGYQVSNIIGLWPGAWTFRVLARNTVTGDFDEIRADNVQVEWRPAPARNLRAAVSGNSVTIAWDPPTQGTLTGYRVEGATDPSFAGFSHATLPPNVTSITTPLPNGTFYIRVVTKNDYSVEGPPSNVITITLPGGGGAISPPGPVTLTGQLTSNPVSLNWSQAGGGAATYTLHAGSRSGASDIVIVPMGASTGLPPTPIPVGATFYARIVASNAGGSVTSNEVVISVPVPGPPGGPPIMLDPIVSGHDVTLRWNPPFNSPTPTGYVIVARIPGSSDIIATLPVTTTSFFVPGVPSGAYAVTTVAIYGSTPSIESNSKTLVVQ